MASKTNKKRSFIQQQRWEQIKHGVSPFLNGGEINKTVDLEEKYL